MNSDGQIEPLTNEMKKKITLDTIEAMASNGLRTICIAYKDFYPSNKCKIIFFNKSIVLGDGKAI